MVTSSHSVGDDCTLPITPEYHVIPPKISQLPPPPNFSGDGGWLIPYPRIIQSKAKLRSMRSTTWERGGWGMGCTCVNFCRVPIIFNTIRSWKCDPIQCHIPIKLSLRSTPPPIPPPPSLTTRQVVTKNWQGTFFNTWNWAETDFQEGVFTMKIAKDIEIEDKYKN